MADAFESIQNGIDGILEDVRPTLGRAGDVVTKNPIATAAVIGGAVVAAGAAAVAIAGNSSKASSKRKRIKHTKRGWKQDRARRSKQKWEVAYQKRKKKKKGKKSRRGIKYTKAGQPYIILKSGKARFIKKKKR